jgi:hypothetical protein
MYKFLELDDNNNNNNNSRTTSGMVKLTYRVSYEKRTLKTTATSLMTAKSSNPFVVTFGTKSCFRVIQLWNACRSVIADFIIGVEKKLRKL